MFFRCLAQRTGETLSSVLSLKTRQQALTLEFHSKLCKRRLAREAASRFFSSGKKNYFIGYEKANSPALNIIILKYIISFNGFDITYVSIK